MKLKQLLTVGSSAAATTLMTVALCSPAAAQNAAVVNGKAIPSAKVDEIVAEVKKQGQPDSPELRSQIREDLVMREVFMQEAVKQKIADRPEIKLALENARQRILFSALAQDYIKSHPITDADVQAEYDSAKQRMGNAQEYHARHILVEKEDDAKAIIAKLKGGAKFEDLAKQSKDPGSAANGGDLDWAPATNYVPEFADALTKLTKGQITETPVKTQFGYHVIKLEDTRATQFPPFEQVKKQIQESLQQKKLATYQKQLRDAAKVQ
ncbi:peptidylprolyl isomerase [Derxia lacustris]|uniref:peptidylprolyl isomerase n=1 Tax=Derxia lacustris TaxID=764842 RepID=UPI000A176E3B